MNRRVPFALLLAATAPCLAAISEPAGISTALRPMSEEAPAFSLAAQGVQIYVCRQRASDPNAFGWAFVAPEATLTEGGATVGRHYAGPTWESSTDRSSVKGVVRERQDGGAGNIPWLRLVATPAEADGKFAGVSSILRVATKGGIEPTTPCDASKSGQESRVPYTADYYFYKKK